MCMSPPDTISPPFIVWHPMTRQLSWLQRGGCGPSQTPVAISLMENGGKRGQLQKRGLSGGRHTHTHTQTGRVVTHCNTVTHSHTYIASYISLTDGYPAPMVRVMGEQTLNHSRKRRKERGVEQRDVFFTKDPQQGVSSVMSHSLSIKTFQIKNSPKRLNYLFSDMFFQICILLLINVEERKHKVMKVEFFEALLFHRYHICQAPKRTNKLNKLRNK